MVNRATLPSWVNALIDRLADSPNSIVGRIAARRLGTPAPVGTVSTVEFDEAPIRLLVTPLNFAGQATAWARATQRELPGVSARSVAVSSPSGFNFDADLLVPVGTFHNDPDWQRRQFDATTLATHLLIESETPPFGRLLGRSLTAQVEAISARGVRVAYMAHGTDVRLPSRHRARDEWSYFAEPGLYTDRAETVAARNIAFLRASGSPVFVSTPDLLVDLPDAHWCPVVVDPARWHTERPARLPGAPLRVAHAPSNAIVKGTPLILPLLERLHDEGVIDFQLLQGIPSAQMPQRLARADVVIDQFRLGSYGAVACEAMAAGCAVIGHVSEQVRGVVQEMTGIELPVIEATPDDLEQQLRTLAATADLDQLRRAGELFVDQVHDGRLAAQVLHQYWLGS